MKNMMFALFMLMSPLMLIFNFISDRQSGAADYKKNLAIYEQDLASAQDDLAAAVSQEKTWLRHEWPDAASTLITCLLPSKRLWERRRRDPDALALRVGTAAIPSTVKVTGADDGKDHLLIDVPIGIQLSSQPVFGIAGPSDAVDGALRWAITQLAAYHPTRDLSCSFIGRDAGSDWSWLQWLPHFRPAEGSGGPVAHVFTADEAIGNHVAALSALVKARQDVSKGRQSEAAIVFPAHVVAIRDYQGVRMTPGLGAILDDGPAVSVFALCTDREEKTLPEQCTATLVLDPSDPTRGSLRRLGESVISGVLVERVSSLWCDLLARELSPLIDIGAEDQEGALPSSSRLLDVIHLDPPSSEAIQNQWHQYGRTTSAVIGEAMDGPFSIDIRKDGPHGLVAGTTGSGKSELLQTIIASLAVNNRPDEMNYVLIDYKGGAAFKDCNNLPHTVGMVTDLDGHLTNRALESLSAELRRREHQLARAGAKDIEDYLAAKTPEDEPLPRLLIVIDEFAALVQELPDFVNGLIDITRRGRSLGTHLILATQRPAGVVSAEIKANTNLRICLRVTDPGDSSDVVDVPDSAYITLPGRANARLGQSSLISFQASRVGGLPPGAQSNVTTQVWPYNFTDLASAPPAPSQGDDGAPTVPTDLASLVEAARQASKETGIVAPPPPWLPALDTTITIDQILKDFPKATPSWENMIIPLGLCDIPSEQRRDVGTMDIAHGTHLAVIGAARTGRSTCLRAIAGAIGTYLSPLDVHIYGVDCGNNALAPLVALPHVGAVVTRDQAERLDRLCALLQRIISQRQQQLATQGYADVAEQRAHAAQGERLPYIVVLFDGWEGFTQVYENHDGGRLVAVWQQILQEGASVGIRMVVSGDRSLLAGRTSALFPDKLILRMPDPSDFSIIGMSPKSVPSIFPAGRGFRSGNKVETQIALLSSDSAGTAQVAALQTIARNATQRWIDIPQAARPGRVDVLPVSFPMKDIGTLVPQTVPPTSLPVGVGGDTLSLRCLDAIEHGPALLVTGARRSGRSTVLRTMAGFALGKGWNVAIFTPRISPLRSLERADHVFGPFSDTSEREEVEKTLADLRQRPEPSLVLADDIEVVSSDSWLLTVLAAHVPAIRDSGSLFVGAGSPSEIGASYSGLFQTLKRAHSGVMLCPHNSSEAEMFGAILQRSAYEQSLPPGGGYIVRAGSAERIQVIWPDAESLR